jgi:hypothetical protein
LTIKNATALFTSESIIIVQPGGKLAIDGGVLTAACPDEMWQGIIVFGNPTQPQLPQYQGSVELKKGAIIEHAHCSISAIPANYSHTTTGGIVKAENSIFRNYLRAVEYTPYENHDPNGNIIKNEGRFTKCTFTIDNNNRFTDSGIWHWSHVTIWGVRDVTFEGCTFEDKTGISVGRLPALTSCGINTLDASVKVMNHFRRGGSAGADCTCLSTHTTPSKFGNNVHFL